VVQGHRVAEAFVFLLDTLFVGAPGKPIVLQELLAVAQRAAQPHLFVAETKTHAPAPAVHFRRQGMTSNAVQLPSPIVAAAVVMVVEALVQSLAVQWVVLRCWVLVPLHGFATAISAAGRPQTGMWKL